MPINEKSIKLYLELEGHLPEAYLLEEIFGVEPNKARQLAEELKHLSVENNPAVRAMHIAGIRKQLRKKYGLAEVPDEEISIMNGMAVAHSVHQQASPLQGIRLSGSLGEVLGQVLGAIGVPTPPPHNEQDQPSSLGVEDFFRKMRGNPPAEEEEESEDDASE